MTKIYGGEDAERGVGGWTRFEKALIPCKLNHNTMGRITVLVETIAKKT
jgi:hypothetical protein